MKKLVIKYGSSSTILGLGYAINELEAEANALLRQGAVPQGGVSVACGSEGSEDYIVMQAFLIDER